jgi:hypothetical protein
MKTNKTTATKKVRAVKQVEANAALIVKAINSFDAHEACEKVLRRIVSLSGLNAPPKVIGNEIAIGAERLAQLEKVRKEGGK